MGLVAWNSSLPVDAKEIDTTNAALDIVLTEEEAIEIEALLNS